MVTWLDWFKEAGTPMSPMAAQVRKDLAAIAAQRQQAIQGGLQNALTNSLAGRAYAGANQEGPSYCIAGSMVNKKAQAAFERAQAQLPFAVCAKISSLRFGPENISVGARYFEVVYTNRRSVQFENVDSFPTDADIARICLEAP